MKNRGYKTCISFLITGTLAVSALTGCSSSSLDENTAMEVGETSVAKSLYQWYLIQAHDEAYEINPEAENLFTDEIEGMDGKEWICERAIELVKHHVAAEKEFADRNLELSEEILEEIDGNVETFWNAGGYSRYYSDFSVDEEAFRAYLTEQQEEKLLYEDMEEDLMESLTEEALLDYCQEHCAALKYIAIPFPNTEEDSINYDEKSEMEPEEADTTPIYEEIRDRAMVAGELDALIDEVESEESYLEIGCSTSKQEEGNHELFYDTSESVTKEFMDEIKAADSGVITAYEDTANQYWILYEKSDVTEIPEEYERFGDTLKLLLAQETFEKEMDQKAEELEVTENTRITRKQNLEEMF